MFKKIISMKNITSKLNFYFLRIFSFETINVPIKVFVIFLIINMNFIINWNKDINECQKHKLWLPSPSLRSIIVGRSGRGKTNLPLNLLLQDDWIDYDEIILCGKSL